MRFYYTKHFVRRLKAEAEHEAELEAARLIKDQQEEEARRRKYAIVDKIREEMALKEAT